MAITFPRPFEPLLSTAQFEIDEGITHSPEYAGRVVAVRLSQPRWKADFQTWKLDPKRLGNFRAWISSLGGGIGTFFAYDPARRYPLAYPGGFNGLSKYGGGAFAGLVTGWSVDAPTRAKLSGGGLPADFPLNAGDMASFSWSGGSKRFLVRLLEAQIGSSLGAMVDVAFAPSLPTWVPSDAVLTLAEPSCVMRLVPGSVQISQEAGPFGRGSFSAIQHMEP